MALGWKYSRVAASAASSRALSPATDPIALQLEPLLVEYHQEPLAVSTAVTAMPSNAPPSTSVTLSTCPAGEAKSTSAETSVPTAPDRARVFALRRQRRALSASNTGAALTALTIILAMTVLPPRPASTLLVEAWTVTLPLPLKFAAA